VRGGKAAGPARALYPATLAFAGLLVALAVVLPYRSVPFTRADGVKVLLPAPNRLNHTSDTWDYLQIARQMHRGCGLTSLFTYPPFLPESLPRLTPGSKRAGAVWTSCPGFPLYWRQPGFPALIAAGFAVRGEPDPGVLLWIQGLAIVLLPLATFLLARLLVTPGWAFLAGLWTLLSPLAVSATSPFTATTWFAVLLALLTAALLAARRFLPGVGVLLGLIALFRLETWLLLPGLLTVLWLSRTRRRPLAAALVLLPAGLTVLPWFAHLAAESGSFLYNTSSLLYHATRSYPDWDSSRALAVRALTPWEFLADHPGEVLAKSGVNLLRFGRDLVLLPSPFLAPFLWLAVLRLPAERRPRAFLVGGAVALLILVLALAPLEYAPRFLAGLAPLLTVGAAIGLSRFPRYRRELATVASVIGLVLLAGTILRRETDGTALAAAQDLNLLMNRGEVEPLLQGDAVALSDAPTVYAWIWERRAVWTPVSTDIDGVRKILGERAIALFTRPGGRGDDLAPETVEEYVKRGGIASNPEPPLVVTWPGPFGPVPLRDTAP
jgi:hypothetical protein